MTPPKRFSSFFLAVALTVLWLAGLIGLAIRTANPVTLNARQLYDSTLIISAVLPDKPDAALNVDKEWTRNASLNPVHIDNLKEIAFHPGDRYIIPLVATYGDHYRVTPTYLPDRQPLIYPETPESVEQLETLLESFRQRVAAKTEP